MALTGTDRGTVSGAASATTYVPTPGSTIAAGSLGVFCLAYDNAGSGGSDPFTSIVDSRGNTWYTASSSLTDPAGASAGATLRIFLALMGLALTAGSEFVTVTFNTATTAKAGVFHQVDAAAGFVPTLIGDTAANGASTTPSTTRGGMVSGDMVIGFVAHEQSGAITADSDATDGSWSTIQSIVSGVGLTGMTAASQRKVVTGTTNQTYNLTMAASSDWAASIIQLREAPVYKPYAVTI